MDFARKQLEKFGWIEGSGLGKDGQGMTSAIKPSRRTGTNGLGFDVAKEFVDPWWARAYDDTLKRIDMQVDESTQGTVAVSFREDDDEDDNTKGFIVTDKQPVTDRPFLKMKRRMMKSTYVTFSKGATLCNGEMQTIIERSNKEESSSRSDSEEDTEQKIDSKDQQKTLTDEELFRACGGRTVHKAARFGLKLGGKLARLAAQENALKNLLPKQKHAPGSSELILLQNSATHEEELSEKKKKKKKKKSKDDNDNDKAESGSYDEVSNSKTKSSSENSLGDHLETQEEPDKRKKKKGKKGKSKKYELLEQEPEPETNTDMDAVEQNTKKRKRKRCKEQVDVDDNELVQGEKVEVLHSDQCLEVNEKVKKETKKRKKHRKEDSDDESCALLSS